MTKKLHLIHQDWRFKLGSVFMIIGISLSTLFLYFPPYELKNGSIVEINAEEKSGKFPVHQLPPLLAIGVGSALFCWAFFARRQWWKIQEIKAMKK